MTPNQTLVSYLTLRQFCQLTLE
uniref:Uncharacterized protein n=1 Tax=Arundo donax TaxID=35708 RepID=A0A0A9AS41_ARUDO